MISVSEEISEEISSLLEREQQLHNSLDNLRGQRSKVKEHKQLDKELALLIHKRQNLESLARFEVGMPVHRADSRVLGKVTEITITPGGLAELWVSWDGSLQVPEQPHLLEPDVEAIARIIAVGDRIVIGKDHAARGKTFTVAKLLARGWVETTDENVFPREYWEKVESSTARAIANEPTSTTIVENKMVGESPREDLRVLPQIVAVEAVIKTTQEIGELTEDEEKERHRLELRVERAFRHAGTALQQLRDKRLYRSTHRTFEAYCQERFGFSRDTACLKIAAAEVYDNIQRFLPTNGRQISMPTNERQLRDLAKAKFTPEKQFLAWQQVLEETGGKQPTGKDVKGIVERMKEKPLTLARDYCSIGDVFTLTRLEGVERKYNGCWAIANDLRDFTVAVEIYDSTLTVKPENLQPIDSPDARRQLPQTLKRIRRLRNCGLLDRCAYTILESLGRQVYLTDFEDKLLTFMEQEHGIIDQC